MDNDLSHYFIRGHVKAFNNAIGRGELTTVSGSKIKYAPVWMYMYSDKVHDYFKHMDTRQYFKVPYF